jgi:hypothetical protein
VTSVNVHEAKTHLAQQPDEGRYFAEDANEPSRFAAVIALASVS